ncbi:MAG: hypothetical protein ABSA17_06215 [Rhabdochlamydiaceae bacterium]|jgi:ABC-type phosphate transport system permease subunit
MTDLISQFSNCQRAFWNEATLREKFSTFNITAICAMTTYVSLHILNKESFLELVHNFSFISIPLQGIEELRSPSIIYGIFALTFYNQHLKGRIAPWLVITTVGLGGYLYSSTRRGYEILNPAEPAPKKEGI